MTTPINKLFNRARLDDRQLNELLGMAHGLTADGLVNQPEAEYLQKWLVANKAANTNPVIGTLLERVKTMLADKVLDAEESNELFETLHQFCGGDFEIGELLKSTTLPLDRPTPTIRYNDTQFCFTGTFAFGSRTDCESSVTKLGAKAGSLTMKTDYLIIGAYATDSWAHSSYGRKIEKAMEMKQKGVPIAIIGEQCWVQSISA